MFPFKFEFAEAIESYFLKVKKSYENISHSLIPIQAIYLMYLIGDNKEEINNVILENDLNFYNVNVSLKSIEYLNSLPREIYSIHMYDEEEIFLAKAVGLKTEYAFNIKELHNHIIKYIIEKFPKYSVRIYNLGFINKNDF